MKSSHRKILLVLFGTLLGIIWAEAACRFFYKPPSFHPVPSLFNRLRGERPRWHTEGTYKLGTPDRPRLMTVTTNAYGFRGEEFSLRKPVGFQRLLCLGDSVTFGWGVNNPETFPAQLQQRIRQERRGTIEVLNAGIGDIGLKEELEELPAFLEQLSPDMVILGFYLNDSRPPQGFNDEFLYEGRFNRFFRTSPIIRHSYFLRLVYEGILRAQLAWRLKTDTALSQRFAWSESYRTRLWEKDPTEARALIQLARYDWGAAWDESSWTHLAPLFAQLDTLTRARRIPVALLALPVTVQVYGQADATPQNRLASIAKQYGWRFIDPLPALRQSGSRSLFFDQCHMTPEGNRYVAQALEKSLRPELIP